MPDDELTIESLYGARTDAPLVNRPAPLSAERAFVLPP